jgi:hypothetical protein
VPAVAEMLCQRCGALTHAPTLAGRSAVARCNCGGVRQVVRMVRHASLSPPSATDRPDASAATPPGTADPRRDAAARRDGVGPSP